MPFIQTSEIGEQCKKRIFTLAKVFVYNRHILAHKMRRILSLPFLQNHFYHLCHSSWLQIMSISTKFVQIASRSYTDLIQLKSRWREARTSLPGVLSAESTANVAEDEPTETRQFMNTRSYFTTKFERFQIKFLRIISKFTYLKKQFHKRSRENY